MKISHPWLRAVAYGPVYILCIAPAALLWHRPLLLTWLYVAACIGILLWRHSRSDLVYFFVPFFMGPAGEYFAVRSGAWTYTGETVLPIWLPFVWGLAGIFMKNVSEALSGNASSQKGSS